MASPVACRGSSGHEPLLASATSRSRCTTRRVGSAILPLLADGGRRGSVRGHGDPFARERDEPAEVRRRRAQASAERTSGQRPSVSARSVMAARRLLRQAVQLLPGTGALVRPVFIVGCGRSGTTALGEVLGRHPLLAYLNEPRDIWLYEPRTDIWSAKAGARGGRLRLSARRRSAGSGRQDQARLRGRGSPAARRASGREAADQRVPHRLARRHVPGRAVRAPDQERPRGRGLDRQAGGARSVVQLRGLQMAPARRMRAGAWRGGPGRALHRRLSSRPAGVAPQRRDRARRPRKAARGTSARDPL